MQQYIAYYESNGKNNNTDNIIYSFKKLLINTSKNYSPNINTTNKLFLTLLDKLQNIESINTINLLPNNAFKYQMISRNSIVVFINLVFYNFIILPNLQYNKSEFKELLIDLNAAIRFISNISQLKTLQKIIFLAKLDETITESTNFIFEIKRTLLIDTVNLKTLMKLIISHIVQVNNLFLLYFADIDKLMTYFNNLISKVI